jgi:hypothetical protein
MRNWGLRKKSNWKPEQRDMEKKSDKEIWETEDWEKKRRSNWKPEIPRRQEAKQITKKINNKYDKKVKLGNYKWEEWDKWRNRQRNN